MLAFTSPLMSIARSPPRARPVRVKAISTHPDLQLALAVRRRVFVEEMGLPLAEEFDKYDLWPLPPGISHYLVSVDAQPIATCRINCATSGGTDAKLERMAVDKHARRKGVGLALLRYLDNAEVVTATRGPFFCYAMKDKELFYRNSGWDVEQGHGDLQDAGIPHVAMIRRRLPMGVPPREVPSLSHVMVRTMDISRARRFYSLLGFQDVSRFKTNGLKAAWMQSPYIDQHLELIEVKTLFPQGRASPSNPGVLTPGLGHLSIDLSRACTNLTRYLLSVQKDSIDRFGIKLRILEQPRDLLLGSLVAEVAFMTDPDGTVLELMRFISRHDAQLQYDAQW